MKLELNNIYIHDIEVFPNFFSVTIKEVNGNTFFYEISERRNDIEELRNFYNNLKDKFLVGFNSRAYDDIIIGVMLQYDVDNSIIYKLSQKVINTKNIWESPFKKYLYPNWFQVDLYLYWSKNLRISKKLSLKSLGIQMNYPVTMDLPYDFDKELTFEEMDQVLEYNIHDVNITEMLFLKKRKEFDMRMDVYNEHQLNCFSYDDPKIAMKLLKIAYEKQTGNDFKSLRREYSSIRIKDILLPKVVELIKTQLPLIKNKNDYYLSIRNYVEDLEKMTVSSMGEISAKIVTKQKNGMILESILGSGGIHSTAFKGVLTPKDDECILDIDYSLMYGDFIQ